MIDDGSRLATHSHEEVNPLDICTLDPDELADRLRWIREQILRYALGKERLEDGIAIEVSNAPGMSQRIDHWIELERTCCEGIRFERHAGLTTAQLRIEIHGIDPQGRLFGGLPDLLGQTQTVTQNPINRMLHAGGLGALVRSDGQTLLELLDAEMSAHDLDVAPDAAEEGGRRDMIGIDYFLDDANDRE